MAHKNIILEILEENDISELFLEEGTTTLEMENLISCSKNTENTKEQIIPVSMLTDWITHLRNLEDVNEIINENSGFSPTRGTGKELRITMTVNVKGAIKKAKKDCEFDRVFLSINETLLKILSQRLSFKSFMETKKEIETNNFDQEQHDNNDSELMEDLDLATESF